MGEDELNILLSAMLDETKSISNINNQITTIQDKLKNINISLNIDDFKASIESVFGDIQSKAKKASSQKLEFQSLDNTIKQIQGLSKNLDDIFAELKQIGNVKSVNKIFDDSGNISGFNVKVENLKGNLKELSNYNVLGSLNKDTDTWEYALNRISSKVEEVKTKISSVGNTTTNTTQMSGLQKALDDTVTAYKNGSLKIEDYVTRMQNIMYGKDGTYKADFTNIPEKQRLEYVNKLTRATNDLDKQTTANNNKQLVALTNQQIAIQKIQTALSDANSKYSGFSNADTTSGLQSQITALQQMNPLTAEYRAGLAVLNNDLNNYTKGLQSASTSANAQTKAEEQASKALVDKKVAIDSLEQKLSLLQGNKLINTGELQNVQQMVARLKEVEAGTVGFRNAAKLATSEVNKLVAQSRAMSTLSTAFKGLTQLLMIGTPLMAIRRVMTEMVSTINELNASMTDIRLVSGMSADGVAKLRDEYNELGKTIGATTKQIMDSAVEFTRQGRSIAETQTLINAAVMGAKLSGTETSSMTDYLTSAVNGYNVAAKDSISIIDKLVAVDNSSASSMSELSIAMSRTAKSAQLAGVDMDTLIGYIGTIESVTRKSAETVGESLKSIFSRMQNLKIGDFVEDGTVVSDVRKTLENVGVALMESETEFRDFKDVISDLSLKWNDLNEAEKAALSKSIAGTRQRENFLVLMDNMSMATDLTTKSLDSNGLAVDRYGIYMESTEAKLNTLKATLEGVFTKTLTSDTVNNIVELTTKVLELTDKMGGLVPVLGSVGLAFAAFKNVGGAKYKNSCPQIQRVHRHQYSSYAKYKFRYWGLYRNIN